MQRHKQTDRHRVLRWQLALGVLGVNHDDYDAQPTNFSKIGQSLIDRVTTLDKFDKFRQLFVARFSRAGAFCTAFFSEKNRPNSSKFWQTQANHRCFKNLF